jgi:hypothetical protein
MQCEMIPVCPALEFPPVALSADDLLPADIVMLLVYRNPTGRTAEALAAGVRAFPHLTGRLDGWLPGACLPTIVPDPAGTVAMEWLTSTEALEPLDFQQFSLDEHLARFAPAAGVGGLFAVRHVDFPRNGMSALCLRVSHLAVDGTGLGLWLAHATAARRGIAAPPVVHDRSALLHPDTPQGGGQVPEGHVECPLADAPGLVRPDVLAAGLPYWFAVPMAAVADAFGGRADASRIRNRFAAWLCGETARIHPGVRRCAIWCNTRGRGGAPLTFTGNAGCYLHMDITGDDANLAREIQNIASREGLARARRVHQEILRLRASGREVWWDGPHDDLLQLNLLSPPVAVADFGAGRPVFALLLSRNSSGLRMFPTACGSRLLVEATLPQGMAAALAEACARRGLAPEIWGGCSA